MLFDDIETERLFLKNISINDRDFIFSQFSDDVVNRYLFDEEPVTDMQGADEIITFFIQQPEPRLHRRWVILRKSDSMKMGTCGFNGWDQKDSTFEIGYDMKEEFWGNGYMQEAIKEIIALGMYEMHIKEINACISIDNQRSIRLVENLGFVLSGSSYELFRGKEYLHNVYSLHLTK
jgi:ribosomal-protein-alanine N-acetyltransferase